MRCTRVLYIITGLGLGGAEKYLLRVIKSLNKDKYSVLVIVLSCSNELLPEYDIEGVDVIFLGFTQSVKSILKGVVKFYRCLRSFSPHIIHSWMYHADFITFISKIFCPTVPVIWSIRNLSLDKSDVGFKTRFLAKLCAWFSYIVPDKILCNGVSVKNYHALYGYCKNKLDVIENGFDPSQYYFCNKNRVAFREKYGIPTDAFVIGMAARFHVVKGQLELLRSLSFLIKKYDKLYIVLIGGGDGNIIESCKAESISLGIENKVVFVRQQLQLSSFYSMLDLLVSNSRSEAFSNVIAEAMLTSVPCIVTDVGESSNIVGPFGLIFEVGNQKQLSYSVEWFIKNQLKLFRILRPRVRERIQNKFSMKIAVQRLCSLYEEVVDV